ncbi:MAG: flagellar basal body L-ring protein FlgH [Kofleriaceae bacterium]|jgi:flagellar L-ring protein precursor FlgH|nr:flagellar basal body L-ring protein FlgH [Kofleriaceae bacterium]MBP6840232.1 flagellar basal body L-ring protein FlgH [Kofleriaceae bacterium]MBP9204772.1 flagellar basal body L-ring protein FlgH [Kofleriaceae bacterium]
MNRRRRPVTTLALAVGLALAGCATHITPYQAKRRHFAHGDVAGPARARDGSLYAAGAGMFEDDVASRLGDILVIRIDERDSASRDASTKLGKKDEASYGMPAAVGLLAALQRQYPDLDPSKLFASESEMKFTGAGSHQREGQLSATLPVRVREVLGNGDLFVEGTKVVLVGNEEHHIYVSGLVRRRDIGEDNSVPSSRLADAEIEYTGRGDVTDQQRRGWLSRLMARLWPL